MHQTFAQLPDYDSETDQYNTPNRHYNPTGRWLSPDPGGLKVVNLEDPQTWNMYVYVRNNPTTLSDPTGLQSASAPIPCRGNWEVDCGHAPTTPTQPPAPLPPPAPPKPPPAPHVEYRQKTGETSVKIGSLTILPLGTGYAGHGQGLDNPAYEHVAGDNAGPPPKGTWSIGPMEDYTKSNGKVLENAMVITPTKDVDMTGRGPAFLIHNGNMVIQNSSLGCIILPDEDRAPIGTSGITVLEVVR
jgi:RHS repeat-associated protein